MSNHKLVVSDYDFDAIKTNLKSFLQGQTQFQDYDFEGSSLNILRYSILQHSLPCLLSKHVN